MILLCIQINITYIYCSKTLSVAQSIYNRNAIQTSTHNFSYTKRMRTFRLFFRWNGYKSSAPNTKLECIESVIVKMSIFVCFAHPIEHLVDAQEILNWIRLKQFLKQIRFVNKKIYGDSHTTRRLYLHFESLGTPFGDQKLNAFFYIEKTPYCRYFDTNLRDFHLFFLFFHFSTFSNF